MVSVPSMVTFSKLAIHAGGGLSPLIVLKLFLYSELLKGTYWLFLYAEAYTINSFANYYLLVIGPFLSGRTASL